MHYIDINDPKIINARDEHYEKMRYILKKKLNGNYFNEKTPFRSKFRINKVTKIKSSISNFLNDEDNLKKVLIGTPDELDQIKNKFTSVGLRKSLKRLVNYDSFIQTDHAGAYREYNAYNLAESLNIPTCVYCNRIYTKTVVNDLGRKITRPAFDHWFPKTKYPLLALSFYNLVPSCTVCNSGVKGATDFSLSDYFHPYFKDISNTLDYKFTYDHKNYDEFSFKIKTGNQFSKNSIEAFELESIYKAHEDEIKDLRNIKLAYSEEYLHILEDQILKGVNLDRNDIYRLAFGVHYEEAKFGKRPLSKMKKDILIELDIIS
ncbi:hypothetical protein [Mesonia mobilis]|uniref:hypothetical protein n=1 Tax=Mesonia mobilis TaxID=369791 RepID=UPI0026F02F90|nr:hypothetical protein [Mesonia mobilis]